MKNKKNISEEEKLFNEMMELLLRAQSIQEEFQKTIYTNLDLLKDNLEELLPKEEIDMKEFNNLEEFVSYCETVINNTNDEFILSIIDSNVTIEELLIKIEDSLTIYYSWLGISNFNELYKFSAIIWKAKEIELEYYMELCKAMFNKSYINQIKELDYEVQNNILNND